MAEAVRLQKFLAHAGYASRRGAEEWIREGRVRVNGRVVTELGAKVGPGDRVEVDGQPARAPERPLYLLLYKPAGVVTTAADPQGRRTVIDLLGGIEERVYPVGRLDYHTSGALLLTNDGELANRLMHPRYGVEKTYEALVEGEITQAALDALRAGVALDGQPTAPAECEVKGTDGRTSLLALTLREGRNRQARRMLEEVGFPCLRLARVRYGPLGLHGLRPGEWRQLRADEVAALKRTGQQGKAGSARKNRRSPR